MSDKEIKVIENNKDNKKFIKIFLFSFFSIFIVFGLILTFIILVSLGYTFYTNRGSSSSSSEDDSHEVTLRTTSIYGNLLAYINKEREDLSYSAATELVSVDYESSSLVVVYQNETEPGYIKIDNASLDDFYNQSHKVGDFANTIIKMNKSSESVTPSTYLYKSCVGTFMDTNYVSYTSFNDEKGKSIDYVVHKPLSSYTAKTITENDNYDLFDILYYIVM